MKNTLNKT